MIELPGPKSSWEDELDPLFESAVMADQKGQFQQAELLYRQALAKNPYHAKALHFLGHLCFRLGRRTEALVLLKQSADAAPECPEYQSGYAAALGSLGRLSDSTAIFQELANKAPNHARVQNNLGVNMEQMGNFPAAARSFGRAWALEPHNAAFGTHYAQALIKCGDLDEAERVLRQTISVGADHAESHVILAKLLMNTARHEEALKEYRQAINSRPGDASLGSAYLYAIHYCPGVAPETIFDEHRRWAIKHEAPLSGQRFHNNDHVPDRRLRIGYVSPDFREHSVATFVESLLVNHDHGQFEITAYSSCQRPDARTKRLQSQFDRWRDISRLPDLDASQLIRSDKIDILVDLTGHMAGNRLLAFAHKPAPVQITYVGHPDTTGMRAMDYRMTDSHLNPSGGEGDALHTEKLIRLPTVFGCYRPPDEELPITAPPCISSGRITFGCLNNPAKITREAIDLWCKLLLAIPQSRLILLTAGRSRSLYDAFSERGVSTGNGRVEFVNRLDRHWYFQKFNQIDIALDPFPYNGQTTSCDGFWMGVPLITLAGDRYASRMGVSLLHTLGMSALIATSHEQFVECASALAYDSSRLRELREKLRPRIQNSSLNDGTALARQVEAVYHRVWTDWCSGQKRK